MSPGNKQIKEWDYHQTFIKMVKIKNIENTKNGEPSFIAGRNGKWYAHIGKKVVSYNQAYFYYTMQQSCFLKFTQMS